jgi:anti-sigma factor RsiW
MIQLYLDNELTGSDEQELLTHLESCANCRQEVEELKAFSSRIKQVRPFATAPTALRERILQQTGEQEKKKDTEGQNVVVPLTSVPTTGSSRPKRMWFPAAIAAMLCLAAGLSFLVPHLHREAAAKSFIDTAIMAHGGLSNANMPLDVQSDSPQVVSDWFASRVSFPFRMPNDGIASDDNAKYKLAGGRLMTFSGEPAALLEFKMQNDTVSVLIASGKKAQARGGRITYSSGIRFHSTDRDGLHIVSWENKKLVYGLIFSNTSQKHGCSSCHAGAEASSLTAMLDKSGEVISNTITRELRQQVKLQ